MVWFIWLITALAACPKNNYLLNGFPRTLKQAIFLDKFAKPDVVIYLNVDKRILKSRLLKRANIERRMDDTPEIIEKRLNINLRLFSLNKNTKI